MAFENLASWEWWLVIVLSILLLTLSLYLSVRLVCGRKRLDGGYFLRLVLVSILLLVVVVAVAEAITALISVFDLGAMLYVLITIGFILVIRYLLIVPSVLPYKDYSAEKYWQWSIIITIISLLFLIIIATVVYYISNALGHPIYLFTPV